MDKNFKEEDLYKPISNHFTSMGYKVRGENNFCDLTAMKEEELIIVELKKNLSVDLLIQGAKRQRFSENVYIAIPKFKKFSQYKKWKDVLYLIKRLGLGLILVSFTDEYNSVEIPLHPSNGIGYKYKNKGKKQRKKVIDEFKGRSIDLNTGGSRGKKLITSYREDSLYIACCIDILGKLSPKTLRKLGSNEIKTSSILQKNYYGWFIREERGIYSLTTKGKNSLKEYEKLAEILKKAIKENLNK